MEVIPFNKKNITNELVERVHKLIKNDYYKWSDNKWEAASSKPELPELQADYLGVVDQILEHIDGRLKPFSANKKEIAMLHQMLLITSLHQSFEKDPGELVVERNQRYIDLLGDLPWWAVRQGFDDFCRVNSAWPAPADIRKCAIEAIGDLYLKKSRLEFLRTKINQKRLSTAKNLSNQSAEMPMAMATNNKKEEVMV